MKESARSVCRDVREIADGEFPDFDVLIAGFPCQPFSNAGNRKGVNDGNGRGTLFEECERVLRSKIRQGKTPRAFVFENVRGILSSKMPDGKTTVPEEIRKRMERLGFNVAMKLVCAADYGVPQMRFRVLIVGMRNSLKEFDFGKMKDVVERYRIPSLSYGNSERLLLGSVLSDVPEDEYWKYTKATQDMIEKIGPCRHGKAALEFFRKAFSKSEMPPVYCEGRSWKDIDPALLTPRFRKIHDDPRKYHSPKFFRRFAFGEINGTITASAQPENCGITHPVENRRFSVREIARIQSFPDEFLFDSIPLQSRYKVIGNAVPPVLGWVLAKALIETVEG